MTLPEIAKQHIVNGMGTTCFSRPSRYVAYAFIGDRCYWFAPEDSPFEIRGEAVLHVSDIGEDDWFICNAKGEPI